jgi:hypothetical protein
MWHVRNEFLFKDRKALPFITSSLWLLIGPARVMYDRWLPGSFQNSFSRRLAG